MHTANLWSVPSTPWSPMAHRNDPRAQSQESVRLPPSVTQTKTLVLEKEHGAYVSLSDVVPMQSALGESQNHNGNRIT